MYTAVMIYWNIYVSPPSSIFFLKKNWIIFHTSSLKPVILQWNVINNTCFIKKNKCINVTVWKAKVCSCSHIHLTHQASLIWNYKENPIFTKQNRYCSDEMMAAHHLAVPLGDKCPKAPKLTTHFSSLIHTLWIGIVALISTRGYHMLLKRWWLAKNEGLKLIKCIRAFSGSLLR